MKEEEFNKIVTEACHHSVAVLSDKSAMYSEDEDRLANFKLAGAAQGINPEQALVGMMTKHFISVVKKSKCPGAYTLEQWEENLVDIRNYTMLLGALVKDLHG